MGTKLVMSSMEKLLVASLGAQAWVGWRANAPQQKNPRSRLERRLSKLRLCRRLQAIISEKLSRFGPQSSPRNTAKSTDTSAPCRLAAGRVCETHHVARITDRTLHMTVDFVGP